MRKAELDSPFCGLPVNDLLILPAVLIGHNQTYVFRVQLVVFEFLLSFPLLHIALHDLESLGFFKINSDGHFLTSDIEFHRLTIADSLLLLSAEFDVIPELTIPNLLAEIKKNNIKYPKIVLAQAILETGWFKSSVCRNKHNLFGLTNPRTKTYYEFNHWTESVKAYYDLVQHRYNGGNYLLWLDKIGYAEDKTYVRAVIKVLKQL